MKELCKFVTHAVSNEKQISTFQPPILESNILMSVYVYVPHHLLEMLRTAQISNPWVVSIWNGSQGQFGQKVVKNLEVQRSPWKSLRTWTQETFPESSPTVWVLEQTVISWTRLSKPACGEWRSWWVQQHVSGPLAHLAGENGRSCQVRTNSTEVFCYSSRKPKK